jgi:hypothetical protein
LALGLCAVTLLGSANYLANHRMAMPRFAYSVLVVLLAGTLFPAWVLSHLVDAGLIARAAIGFSPLALAASLVLGGGFMLRAIFDAPPEQRRRAPRLLIALFAPSLAEVLVFVGIVFTLVEHVLKPWIGIPAATVAAILLTSTTFALYHLTHAAPWNSARVILTLFVVWLFVGAFYALSHDLWATAIFNTLLATIGFVKNRVTKPEEQPVLVSVLLAGLAIASVLWLCGPLPLP